MFGKSHMVKVFGSIAVAASIAVVGARTAHAQTFITDTLGGNGHAQASAPFITDTLGGNGHSYSGTAYVYGGASQVVAQAIQAGGKTPSPVPAPPVAQANSTDWSGIGMSAGGAAALMLLLAAALAVRSTRRRVLAA
jgi:hypothetical protein